MGKSYKCKCKICGKYLTTDKAFKVIKSNKNIYYCSEEEYIEEKKNIEIRNKCLNTIKSIINVPIISPAMMKEINNINKFYEFAVIEKCFKEYEKKIVWFLEHNENSSEYGKARYISTIILNNIQSTKKKHDKELKEMEKLFTKEKTIDVDIVNIEVETKPKKAVNDISNFL